MNHILTVTLNAAIDVAYTVPGFGVDQINTALETRKVAGGKGNNVARVLARLGRRVTATGFAGGNPGRFLEEDLERNGVLPAYEPINGETRTCMAILDPSGKSLTELREKGPTITAAEAERFLARFERLLAQAQIVTMSGSLPPGLPTGFYAELIRRAKARGIATILDASGKALREGIAAGPTLVKPNQDELAEWMGTPVNTREEVLAAARGLLAAGPALVAVSLGAEGLLLVTPDQVLQAVPPRIEALNTVGSGDSAVAGLAAGLAQELPLPEVVRLAVAAGTANALTPGVGEVWPEDVERLLPLIEVR